MKPLLKGILELLGYRIIRSELIRPLDLSPYGGNPKSIFYHGWRQPGLVQASVRDGIGLHIFPLDLRHPFVSAVKSGLASPDLASGIRLRLRQFYDRYQPRDALELLDVGGPSERVFRRRPPWALLFPWEQGTIAERVRSCEAAEVSDNRQVRRATLGIEEGWAWCGPVSEKKFEIEVSKLVSLTDSMVKKGFRAGLSDGPITANALIRDDKEIRWQIRAGQHRAAVCAALGIQTVPIEVGLIVERRDVELWPQVINGNYDTSAALALFDRMFSATLTKCLDGWLSFLESNE